MQEADAVPVRVHPNGHHDACTAHIVSRRRRRQHGDEARGVTRTPDQKVSQEVVKDRDGWPTNKDDV